MSLLSKSHDNYCTFLLLTEHGETENANFHTAAVHCAYYSCYQKLIFILKEHYTNRYAELNTRTSGTHNLFISECVGCLAGTFKKRARDITKINRQLKQLKAIRQKSDYEDEKVSIADIEKVKQYLEAFRRIIKETTNL
ncbi:hypothetical protein [Phaeodactylibacter sp.]|uniref:hypothetical protein n=1 Tax=Phaeodactylibacter sp. TaxID=1940289 RepID=UPI0025CE7288|nr:hypothetical protein [Phaeodactylibacter sp.]MCI4648921.1 hypothetical protein [Phaeodactylibacter sp.]MCI5092655.1 hypothetical protein [Phaeodactylibacter sp.]